MKEVVETWEGMKFTIIKYMKGTVERGSILGPCDEILQILDDNAMNLQSMSASRFIGPFLTQVGTRFAQIRGWLSSNKSKRSMKEWILCSFKDTVNAENRPVVIRVLRVNERSELVFRSYCFLFPKFEESDRIFVIGLDFSLKQIVFWFWRKDAVPWAQS